MTGVRVIRRRPLARLGQCPVCELSFRVCRNGAIIGHGGRSVRCAGSGRIPTLRWDRTVLDSIRTAEDHGHVPWDQRLDLQACEAGR